MLFCGITVKPPFGPFIFKSAGAGLDTPDLGTFKVPNMNPLGLNEVQIRAVQLIACDSHL